MSIIDAIPSLFASVLSPLYKDGIVTHIAMTDDGNGSVAEVADTVEDCKVQVDSYDDLYRASAGYSATDVKLLILAYGITPIDTDCRVTVDGITYSIANINRDPAQSYYDCRGVRFSGS